MLTRAHAAVTVGAEVVVGAAVVVLAAMQLQALEILASMPPFWFGLQALIAYEGMAVGATLPAVKVPQKARASARRVGTEVALRARRQLSAAQSPATTVARRRVVKAYFMMAATSSE